jgi:hypothetical protein
LSSRRARYAARVVVLAASAWALAPEALAEPYLAVRTGLQCSACHVNRTGGGGRTAYGAGYGSQSLPMFPPVGGDALFDGGITERVRVGSDFRGQYIGHLQDEGPYVGTFEIDEANLYLTFDLLPDRILIHVDERFAPGGAVNREAFALVRAGTAGMYAKVGKFFLPYGLRIQDDRAFPRRFTGFNFTTQDVGVEVGAEGKGFFTSLAVTNGTGGGSETNNGKQVSWIGGYARKGLRMGLSASHNDLAGDPSRALAGAFVGYDTGTLMVLAEVDGIRDDDGLGSETTSATGHVEVDWTIRRGLLVRAWMGRYDPDRDGSGDRRTQAGGGIDWTAWPGVQVRAFYRAESGPEEVAGANDDQAVFELHFYF